MGYRQRPRTWSLGCPFPDGPFWRLAFDPDACYMHFAARLAPLCPPETVLYLEGTDIDPAAADLYRAHAAPDPLWMPPADPRRSSARFHVAPSPTFARSWRDLAARLTFAQLGTRLRLYDPAAGILLIDGDRLDERRLRVADAFGAARVRRLAARPLDAVVERVEP